MKRSEHAGLTEAQERLLQKAAAVTDGDGAPIYGGGRHNCARRLQSLGFAELLIGGEGRMSRVFITDAGRAALAAARKE